MFKNIKWKSIIKEIVIGAVVLLVLSNLISYLRKPDIGDESFPKIVAQSIESKAIDTADYRDKPLLIHFWATWCPVCKIEIANIQRVADKYQVITIAVESGSVTKIAEFLKEKGVNFDVIDDENGTFPHSFNVEVFPTTLIYGSSGKLIFSEVGYTTTAGLLARMAWAEEN